MWIKFKNEIIIKEEEKTKWKRIKMAKGVVIRN